jgi:hypothetical protein
VPTVLGAVFALTITWWLGNRPADPGGGRSPRGPARFAAAVIADAKAG